MKYAGFWIRVGASLIDAIVGTIIFIILSNIIIAITHDSYKNFAFSAWGGLLGMMINITLVTSLTASPMQGTIGKYMLGLKVIDTSGNRLTLLESFIRNAVYVLPVYAISVFLIWPYLDLMKNPSDAHSIKAYLPIFLGHILTCLYFAIYVIPIAFTTEKKGLHDMACDTRVVRKEIIRAETPPIPITIPYNQYAGFWLRGIANFIDVTLCGIALTALAYMLDINYKSASLLIQNLLMNALLFIYMAVFTASRMQGTIGKYVLGLKVTNISGNKLNILHSCVRSGILLLPFLLWIDDSHINRRNNAELLPIIIKGIFIMICYCIWYLPIALTAEKKGVYDMLCNSRVLKKEASQFTISTEYAGFWRRIGAGTVDIILFALVSICIFSFIMSTGLKDYAHAHSLSIIGVIEITLCMAYIIIGSLYYQKGTLGNSVLNIHAVHRSGSKQTFLQSFIRLFILALPFILLFVTLILMSRFFIDSTSVILGVSAISLFIIAAVLQILIIIPIACTAEKKGLHDMICNTRVMKRVRVLSDTV